jgi:hypothetical protein
MRIIVKDIEVTYLYWTFPDTSGTITKYFDTQEERYAWEEDNESISSELFLMNVTYYYHRNYPSWDRKSTYVAKQGFVNDTDRFAWEKGFFKDGMFIYPATRKEINLKKEEL